MLNNSQYTIIIQYTIYFDMGGGLAPPPPAPGSYAYVCVSLCYWCPVSCMIVNEALIYNNITRSSFCQETKLTHKSKTYLATPPYTQTGNTNQVEGGGSSH